jgi:hypothetical protein
LREVAALLAGGSDLFRVEADVVRVGEHLLEADPRLVEAPERGERLDIPKVQSEKVPSSPRSPSGDALRS